MSQEIVLVTGGTGDIGTAICKRMAQNGACVIAAAKENDETADFWKKRVDNKNIHFEFLDVSEFDACNEFVTKIEGERGRIDVLVNAAGICRDARFLDLSQDDWDQVLKVDLDSMFYVTRHVVPVMLKAGYGRIVNISSINGLKGQFGQVNYSAAKAGVYGFTKSLASEMGRKGITVNSVSPGYIDSNMVMGVPEHIRDALMSASAVGRLGQPDEVARVVEFLAHRDSGFITGTNYVVDGGLYMY